jgi:hypothetical protein
MRGRWIANLWRSRTRLTKRRAMIMIAGLCLCAAVLGGGMLLFRKLQAPAAAPAPAAISGTLAINAVNSARVGDAVTVTVGPATATNGLPATLTMISSYGPRMYRSTFAGGTARFLIPSADTHESGQATLIALAGAARGEAALTLEPDAPIDPITPLVGSRSITADTKHWSMSVVVPFDRFGNPVADGTPVSMRALHPGDQLELKSTKIQNMIGWERIFSRTLAGRTTVSVSSAGKYGPDATFMEVPGWPAPFALSASPGNVPADGRQFVTLRTDVIRDKYGNPMLDGTLVTFVANPAEGEPRLIPAYTIDGVAKALLQAPSEPGELTVRAEVYDAESRPLQVVFGDGPALDTFPVEARIDAAGQAIDLKAGPMLGALQQFIPDGTVVEFWLTDATGQRMRIEAVSKNGYAEAVTRLATLPLGTYTAEANVGSGHGRVKFQVPYETLDKKPFS